jgi:hypothetical protein
MIEVGGGIDIRCRDVYLFPGLKANYVKGVRNTTALLLSKVIPSPLSYPSLQEESNYSN